MEAAAKSNLKDVTLELGGKSPNIIFNDCDLDQAVNWAAHGILYVVRFCSSIMSDFLDSWNHGQACCAGSRIFVQSGIYDEFLKRFTERTKNIKVGDPFAEGIDQGPQVSQQQYDRIMGYIQSGKEQGATVHHGGERHGSEGYFISPTIFTNTTPDMKIVQEEIFGPVGVVIKFEDEEDVIRQANDTGTFSRPFLFVYSQRFRSLRSCRRRVLAEHQPCARDGAQAQGRYCMGQLRQPATCECSFRWLQAERYWTGVGRVRAAQVRSSFL